MRCRASCQEYESGSFLPWERTLTKAFAGLEPWMGCRRDMANSGEALVLGGLHQLEGHQPTLQTIKKYRVLPSNRVVYAVIRNEN